MSDDFLARWSRRKRRAGALPPDTPAPAAPDVPDDGRPPAPDGPVGRVAPAQSGPVGESGTLRAPADVGQLPPIESITAETDIRAFLAPGVPSEVRNAALRRAWVADPKVRDFVGLADYDWDFNTPGAVTGFGPLQMTDALRREVMRIVGASQGEPDSPAAPAATAVQTAADGMPPAEQAVAAPPQLVAASAVATTQRSASPIGELPQRSDDIALQNSVAPELRRSPQEPPKKPPDERSAALPFRRPHGGALPQ